jgi:hypothetical protein
VEILRTPVRLGAAAEAREGCFTVLFILGDRAANAARASRLGRVATRLIDEAPHYPEGTGIRLEVSRAKDIPLIKKLARIRLEN